MVITHAFLIAEIRRMEAEREQASRFVTAIQGAIDGYKVLAERTLAPEAEPDTQPDEG